MPLTPADLALVAEFRTSFEDRYRSDPRFSGLTREDRPDQSSLCTRCAAGPRLWLELCVRPNIPQVRVGIMTDDRWRNEELEEAIEETGDTMSEFVELGFDEIGLEWRSPVVEHYRDQGKYFYFATALDLPSLADLRQPATRQRVAQMFDGYYEAFRHAIAKASAAAAE